MTAAAHGFRASVIMLPIAVAGPRPAQPGEHGAREAPVTSPCRTTSGGRQIRACQRLGAARAPCPAPALAFRQRRPARPRKPPL